MGVLIGGNPAQSRARLTLRARTQDKRFIAWQAAAMFFGNKGSYVSQIPAGFSGSYNTVHGTAHSNHMAVGGFSCFGDGMNAGNVGGKTGYCHTVFCRFNNSGK